MSKELVEKLENIRRLNIQKRDLEVEIAERNKRLTDIDYERAKLKKELEMEFEEQLRRGLQ